MATCGENLDFKILIQKTEKHKSVRSQLNDPAALIFKDIIGEIQNKIIEVKDLACSSVGGYTPGSVIFAGSDGTLTENNSKFFWDNTALVLDVPAVSSGAFLENGLKSLDIGTLPHGTVVTWKDGRCVESYKSEDEFVMGVVKHGHDEPIILGAEPILVTGKVEEGDYLVTSNKDGHCMAVKRGIIFKKNLFGKVIAQALESSDKESNLIKAMIRKM